MKKENAVKANNILKKIEVLESSMTATICNRILEEEAPYLFGSDSYEYKDEKGYRQEVPAVSVRKRDVNPFDMAIEKDEIQDEYIRFIERVKRLLDKKIAKLQKELDDLPA